VQTADWWAAFWQRSTIKLLPSLPEKEREQNEVWRAGRNYQLVRYMLGCNSSGQFPTLFNGGFFTFDNPPGRDFPSTPDERFWQECSFMAQNQRLLYWPMLRSGDADVLRIALDFYLQRAPAQRARVEKLFQVKGVAFHEALDWLGLSYYASKDGHSELEHLKYHYTSLLDFTFLMTEAVRYEMMDAESACTFALEVLSFFDHFYQRQTLERTGKALNEQEDLVLYPSSAVEACQGCTNAVDVVAGLQALADSLKKFSAEVLDSARSDYLEALRQRLPALPRGRQKGEDILLSAQSYEKDRREVENFEFPAMYAVFPFHRLGVGLPEQELALNTWRHGWIERKNQDKEFCWYQNGIFTARLGLTEEAARYNVAKMDFSGDPPRMLYPDFGAPTFATRFPAFFNPYGFCHPPCLDGGGCGMIGFQEMLLQTPGDALILFPAWPKEWDVEFKLHAPGGTIIEARQVNGCLTYLSVLPLSRRKDVVISPPFYLAEDVVQQVSHVLPEADKNEEIE
jgi:hypothetical protein